MHILIKTIKTKVNYLVKRGSDNKLLPPWWLGYSLALFFPLSILLFLLTGPHQPLATLAWTIPMWILVAADYYGPPERRIVPGDAPQWFFDGLLYALVIVQLLNVFALGLMVSKLQFGTTDQIAASILDLLAIRLMVGANFTCAGLCPAHELIHRQRSWQRGLGRLMLLSLCYDHFAVSHKRLHHARLGDRVDPSTAHPDEDFEHFFRRAVQDQWKFAWRADRKTVTAGIAAEFLLLLAYNWAFGPLAVMVYLFMVFSAVRTLESVNYFQHYALNEFTGLSGLTAWRCDSAVSLYLFVGLTRHADHHRHPGLTYKDLRPQADGPVMPFGYLGMAVWVQRRNPGYRRFAAKMQGNSPRLSSISN